MWKTSIISLFGLVALNIFSLTFAAAASETLTTIVGESARWLEIDRNSTVRVRIIDNVEGGCWTNQDEVKAAVEREMTLNGYEVNDPSSANIVIILSSIGFALDTDDLCAVYYAFDVYTLSIDEIQVENHKIRSFSNAAIWDAGGLWSGPKANANNTLREAYLVVVQNFIDDIDEVKSALLDAVIENAPDAGGARQFWIDFDIHTPR